ncbi:MAG: 30S ribosomal protein S12 methylthiotransferase RimO [Bacteroides sp.]|nr:30S ribosomal protein S12 methylthiotransferase RimO [Bacteroides sp.]MCM1549278.1 30S ribosomal protein S12 methylthiotransferase RimO [Clostridium sp.]
MNILFVSLGCDKNLVDSEVMLSLLKQNGYNITNDEQEADAIVVNTCCFIHDAKEESIQTIIELAQLKQTARLQALVVTGCLAQRYQDEIRKELPEVDAILGSTNVDDIVSVVTQALEGKKIKCCRDIHYLPSGLTDRVVTTGNAMAYLKLAEGCSKRCTYCIIPYLRGNYRSIPMEEILETAGKLAAEGYQELVLVAQEITVYGQDLYGEKRLPKLLEELSRLEGIHWIRLLYCYPEEITDELIRTMAENKKVCHYIDMPIQHSEDAILKAMGRRTSQKQIRDVVARLRAAMPDIVIRTTLITGFPGETREQHEALLAFVDEMEFQRLGVFPYSPEEGTQAADYPNQIAEEEKKRRQDEIMALQQEVSYDNNQRMLGAILEVLVEGYLYEEDIYIGRSYREAPGVDGYIFLSAEEEIVSGERVKVRITDANEYDLIGEVVYEFTE